jgi:hypothetical protein
MGSYAGRYLAGMYWREFRLGDDTPAEFSPAFVLSGTCDLRPALLLSAAHFEHPVDSGSRFFVICDYTGKEVVG